MKYLLVNNTGKKLIEEKGFFVADTSSLPALITKYTFIKEKWGVLYLLNFVDTDNISFNNHDIIKDSFYKEMSFFKINTNANTLFYIKVFVTSKGLSLDDIDNILKYSSHSIVKRSSFVPVILDLQANRVIMNPDRNFDKIGIIPVLEKSLDDKDYFNEITDLERIQTSADENRGYRELQNSRQPTRPVITYILIALNIGLFALMEFAGGTQNPYVLMYFGIKINSLIVEGQYWRLLSSAFIHIGFAHIAFNMYGLFNLGTLVEKIYGSKKYLFIYLTAALWGSISSFIFSPIPSAGASGAIFGLFGALLYLGRRRPRLFSTSFGTNVLIVLGFNLVYGFTAGGIDNFAHIGGLIGGYLSSGAAGLATDEKPDVKRTVSLILSIALIILGLFLGIKKNTI